MTGLSISCYQELKKAWCIFASIMVAYILPLWEIMEPVEFKLDVSGTGWDKVYLYIKIYPPTKQWSACAEEWHESMTVEVFRRHLNESWYYMGENSGDILTLLTSSECHGCDSWYLHASPLWYSFQIPQYTVHQSPLRCPPVLHSISQVYWHRVDSSLLVKYSTA